MRPKSLPVLIPLCLSLVSAANAQSPSPAAASKVEIPIAALPLTMPVSKTQVLWATVQEKNFYLLSLIEKSPKVIAAMDANPTLKKMATDQAAKLSAGFNGGVVVPDAVSTLVWSQADIDAATEALRSLYRSDKAVKEMVDGPLRQSGAYERSAQGSGEDLLAQAWINAVGGLNKVVGIYGLGDAPHYPKIDSPFYDVKSPSYAELTNIMFGVLAEDQPVQPLFFQPTLRVAVALLDANRRDEAGRFEPMEQGENAAAAKRAKTIAWDKYPYALILAPGQGPDETQVVFSPKAKLVMGAIAKRFREGKAPFILVSGGYVHPAQTPFCEAIEMKRSLMNDYNVPKNAIIIDPHARHTTTNVRNAARLMIKYGIPISKTALITTTPEQVKYIDRKSFQTRCQKELGYQPATYGKRISPFDIEFTALRDSLQIDPTEPLDP